MVNFLCANWKNVNGDKSGSCAYFSMTDVEVRIPGNKSILPPENHSIITLYALEENGSNTSKQYMQYSIINSVKEHNLQIYRTTGDIMFTERFLYDTTKDVTSISVVVHVNDSYGEDNTTFHITVTPFDFLGCDFFVKDLCFWQSADYRIFENARASAIGSISSPYFAEICPGYKIKYNLTKGGAQFILMPHINGYKSWDVRSTRPLDRDVPRMAEPFKLDSSITGESVNITVVCNVEDPQGSVREVEKDLVIDILDEDDNVPVPQEKGILRIYLDNDKVTKGQVLQHKDLIFVDRDSIEVNHYEMKILNDKLNILKEVCTALEDDRDGERQTVIHCKLSFTKNTQIPNFPYKVILQINDTSLRPGYGNSVVKLDIYIVTDDEKTTTAQGPSPDIFRPLLLYPSRQVKIFSTAAPYARVTQPEFKRKENYTFTSFNIRNSNSNSTFWLTTDGIVYVNNVASLRSNHTNPRVQIEWKKNGVLQSDEIIISIINEPTHTCNNINHHPDDWPHCSEYDVVNKCEKGCGLGTGGQASVAKRLKGKSKRCMWRGEKRPGNGTTPLYSTCTPDSSTCPDRICDTLEQLHPLICPQDCSETMIFPTRKNEHTGRGIDVGSGVCTCDRRGQCTCNIPPEKKKPTPATQATTQSPQTPAQANLTNHLPPHLSRHTGNEIASCGTTCMLGIAAGIVFLLGAVAVVVACWRLDRVQKAVRAKFTDDAPDLNAPLSDYVDRGILSDPLQLNFDMAILNNQINKLAPDPKWEFPRNQLVIEQTLGEGEFGKVLRARAKDIAGQQGYTTVAVKTLKDDAQDTELADLLSEYQLLKEVSHPNIIRLLGASTLPGGPVYLIIEFAQFGSLRSYLRRSRHLKSESQPPATARLDDTSPHQQHYDHPTISRITPKDILSFAWQISNGMSYLSDIKLVHRDLAARNVLLASGKICKISDFGLTRDIYEDNAYFKRSKGRVPVKWMAPESLSDHLYTTKSDVWSFGILVWELVTLGATPYPGIPVQNLFHLLRQGYRMERPENCSLPLYKIMRGCWHIEPDHRPKFSELAIKFEKMLSDGIEYLDLTTNIIHNRSYFCTNCEDTEDEENMNNNINKTSLDSVNYLEKLQQYVKCGESEKLLEPVPENEVANEQAPPIKGYETPVKISQKPDRAKTPTNECPQYYTDMAAGNSKITA